MVDRHRGSGQGPRVAAFGSWVSPITASFLVERAVRLLDPIVEDGTTWWVEGRPSENGRQVLVRRGCDGQATDAIPEPFSTRTLVHEYGGLSFAIHGPRAIFSNFSDQRLYGVIPGSAPVPLTPEPPVRQGLRYGAPVVVRGGSHVICVRERHLGPSPSDVVNDLVAVPTDASAADDPGAIVVVSSGHDFYGAPAVSPDGGRVAFVCWDHPLMAWDGSQCYEVPLSPECAGGASRLVAGGREESVTQVRYDDAGRLHLVSDRTGWWNLYRERRVEDRSGVVAPGTAREQSASAGAVLEPLAPGEAEYAGPDWVLGRKSFALLKGGVVVATWTSAGRSHVGMLGEADLGFVEIETPYSAFEGLSPSPRGVICVASSAELAPEVVEIAVPSGAIEVLRRSRENDPPPGYVSRPSAWTFPTSGGEVAHALVYLPENPGFTGPKGERPPLVVSVHGGPTSCATASLDYGVQYWTSRGFVVAALDHRGSSGYGRSYRKRLDGLWGVLDREDAEHLARALVAFGVVDPAKLCIHGGSAGGYTVLSAAAFGDVFVAGASYYGVADPGALARDTHKFESRYLDNLIGPWPESRSLYEERSPLAHADRIRMPLVLFQGLEDRIVPPDQAATMTAALEHNGVAVALVTYEAEQHGFRKAESIMRTAEAELCFYGRVLGFVPADEIDPLEIRNAATLDRSAGEATTPGGAANSSAGGD